MSQLFRLSVFAFASIWISSGTSYGQQIGTCETGSAQSFLDANNVRAAIYNAGNLFSGGSGNAYTVPLRGHANSMLGANLWIGGLVKGELRFAGSDYGPFDYFPGPLTPDGRLPDPSDCSAFDRIYEITQRDLDHFDATGEATVDMVDWPWQHGAPVADGDDDPANYDLAAGDRPALTGHQMLWWVMNDLGGEHEWRRRNGGATPPLGVEVRSSAFAVLSTNDALDNSTFYRYEIENPQSYAIDSVFVALWLDPDVGNAGDDYIGSDTTLGMGFAYNGDDFDDSSVGYGDRPPAIGFDIVKGPLAEEDGVDNDRDGDVDESGERMGMTRFMHYFSDNSPQGNMHSAADAYNYMRAIWRDGTRLKLGGVGYGDGPAINFFYPGDPVASAFWSEGHPCDACSPNHPSERFMIVSTGPIQLEAGATEEIVIAVVWARGDDRLDSVAELRKASVVVQDAWDAGRLNATDVPPAPTAGPLPASPADGVSGQPLDVTLTWEYQDFMTDYTLELASTREFDIGSVRRFHTKDASIRIDDLDANATYYWRVMGLSPLHVSPPSPTMSFQTSDVRMGTAGLQIIPGTNLPAFVEVVGPGGTDPCGPEATSTDGCAEIGGNFVYGSENSTGEYIMYRQGFGPEAVIGDFAPNDFEIRFTEKGSYAYNFFGGFEAILVPFEAWDIGSTPAGAEGGTNDASDDVQMIVTLNAGRGGQCAFDFGEGDDPFGRGWGMSDRIYAYYPTTTYEAWEEVVRPIVEADPNGCPVLDDFDPEAWTMIDFGRFRPIQQVTFNAPAAADPSELLNGTVIRFYTTPPPEHPPVPGAPASGTGPHEQPLALLWSRQQGNVTSQIQISAGPTFADPVIDATTTDGSFVVSGLDEERTYIWRVRQTKPESGWSGVWTFTAGVVTNVSAQTDTELPRELTLEQNYPNPFNPSTTIRFGLPEAGRVQIDVYDLLGRHIAKLLNDTRPAGWHEVRWDAGRHASGMYVYTIHSGQRRRTRSMVLLR